MPDIQTAFQIALAKTKAHIPTTIPADWDDENPNAPIEVATTKAKEATMPKQFFVTTNNVTRATFDFVLNNPGKSRIEIVRLLSEQGFNKGSTSSLLGQFIRQGQLAERNGFLFAQQAEYKPLKASQRKVEPTPKPVAKEKPVAKPEAAPQINAAWDADTLLNNLSIKQARALYDELRKIFGG